MFELNKTNVHSYSDGAVLIMIEIEKVCGII